MSELEAVDLGAGVLVGPLEMSPTPAPTTPAPTSAPVATPTTVPTPVATPSPSLVPTLVPVAAIMVPPSRSPTVVPDGMETVEPTTRRSLEPTAPPEAFLGDGSFEGEDGDDQRETAGVDSDGERMRSRGSPGTFKRLSYVWLEG